MSVLPVHAAGHLDDPAGPGRRSVLDRAVSSYVPTVRVLERAARLRIREGHVLSVGVNHAPGLTPLHHAVGEAVRVAELLGADNPPLLEGAATRAAVAERLPGARWAHLACHAGWADDPADSFLALGDGPLPVRDLMRLDVTGGYLAYLSACDTGYGGPVLPDESIHVASALQLAGFQHVVGTLWPIADVVAAELTEAIYTRLGAGAAPVSAVHHAVHELRALYPRNPNLWASHMHFGP